MQRHAVRRARHIAGALRSFCLLLLMSGQARAVEFTTNTAITSADYSGEAIIVTGCTLTIDCAGGKGMYASLLVRSGGVVTHPAGSTNGLWLSFSGDFEVQSGCRIDADARGYGPQEGPGGGASGAGGSHGGTGGYGGAAVYDSVTAPGQLGSGGGNNAGGGGGAGGGLIRIECAGAMTIGGEIRANGVGNVNRSGGSGGGILLSADTLSGAGSVLANGGSGSGASYYYGGGGGGRIALVYASTSFAGTIQAKGGLGRNATEATNGGCGTVYTKGTGETYGALLFDNGGTAGWTTHPAVSIDATDVTVRNGLVIFDCSGNPVRAHDLHAGPNCTISHPAESLQGLYIQVTRDLTIEGTAVLDANAKGYGPQGGPGAGASGAGGSHGGSGGWGGAPVYDDVTGPALLGSGGGNTAAGSGGAGGGLIRIEAPGTLTVNGEIRASGVGGVNISGGSGGTINATVGTVTGSGSISANGGTGSGASYNWGGGGGGRVSILYDTDTYSGTVFVKGAPGKGGTEPFNGGAGTLYYKGSAEAVGVLVFDNVGTAGWTVHPAPDMPTTDVYVRNGLVSFDCAANPLRARDFHAGPSCTLSHPAASTQGLDIQATRNVTMESTATANVNGKGYGPQAGPGGGTSAAGGSHGGTGGFYGAAVYDSVTAPSQLGSGGGNNPAGDGGAGGGRVRVEAPNLLTLDGAIHADGVVATNIAGGSGGSVWLIAGTLTGAGSVTASGGSNTGTSYDHGGGGGGRIAVTYDATTFSGTLVAPGGLGKSSTVLQSGGAGTVYTKGSADAYGTLVFDNTGSVGWTVHPSLDMPSTNVGVSNALLSLDCTLGPFKLHHLTVGPSATVTHPAAYETGLGIEASGDVVINGTGNLDVSGRGYGPQAGPGAGSGYSGGSYGGTGGYGGPAVYGSITAPNLLGSGGSNTPAGDGGRGGGFVRIVAQGSLTVDGTINANGLNANNVAGGSGGSIFVDVGSFGGGGLITANGGSDTSVSYTHGGGGGGRIALLYGSTSFGGSVTAYGGKGRNDLEANNGGPGTVYTQITSRASDKSLLITNGAVIGWTHQPAFDLGTVDLVTQNARIRFDCSERPVCVASLTAQSGSILQHMPGLAPGLMFDVRGDVLVASGASLDVSTQGHPAETGPGAARPGTWAGGSYGGRGGKGGVDPYGIPSLPAFFGSGGGNTPAGEGGSGGGMLTIFAGGTVQVDGTLLANGATFLNRGGGSGGSIRVAANSLIGGGTIAAEGGPAPGASYASGGGGGGRIGLYVHPGQASFPSGLVSVVGGTGNGGNGTDGSVYRGDTYTLPDLSFIPSHSEFHWNGDGTGTANLVVANWGLTDATSVRVELFSGNPALPGTVSLGDTTIGSLPRLASAPVGINIAAMVLTEIWAVVDPANGIAEGSEANNVLVLPAGRTPTISTGQDRTGTITEVVLLRGYLRRATDNAWLDGQTLTFKIDGTVVGSAVVGATGTSGRADLNWVITAGAASRTIGIQYAGDATYNPSSNTATLTCQSWTTKMVVFGRTARITDRTELKARLLRSDNAPLYGKTLAFYIDGTFIINRNTNTDGYASHPNYDVPDGAGAGNRTIRADWAGNAGYTAISREATLTVLKAIPYIWVLSKSVPQGGIANLYSYFRRLYDYKKMENKPVTFKIDGTWIADVNTGTVASGEPGVARYLHNTTGLGLGTHTVRCEFAGDAWVDAGFGEGNLNIL